MRVTRGEKIQGHAREYSVESYSLLWVNRGFPHRKPVMNPVMNVVHAFRQRPQENWVRDGPGRMVVRSSRGAWWTTEYSESGTAGERG